MDKQEAERNMANAREKLNPHILRLEAEMSELGVGGFFVVQGDLYAERGDDGAITDVVAIANSRELNGSAISHSPRYDAQAYKDAVENGGSLMSPALRAVRFLLDNPGAVTGVLSAMSIATLTDPAVMMVVVTKDFIPLVKMPDKIKAQLDEVEEKIRTAIAWLAEHKTNALPEFIKDMYHSYFDEYEKGDGAKTKVNTFAFSEVKDDDGNVVGLRGPDGEVFSFADHEQGDEQHGTE